jgi:hypothetical protein
MYSNRSLRFAVSTLALVVAAVHVWRPDVKIDSITLVLLIIAVLPWTQPLLKSIELLGVKLELQELQAKVAEAKGAAESASQQADLALSVTNAPPQPSLKTQSSDDILTLAHQYNEIREVQRSGDARTAAMTDLVRQMIELARRIESFDTHEALKSGDRGTRLFAYVFLYTKPDPHDLSALVESVTRREDKPFGQYWGLQAIGRTLTQTTAVPTDVVRKLREFSSIIQPGTDRHYELRKILQRHEDG